MKISWLTFVGDGYHGGETTMSPPTTDCFVQGSCDMETGHVATLYNVDSAGECQRQCRLSSLGCQHFTWYEHDHKCRHFTICNAAGENCADCVSGTSLC